MNDRPCHTMYQAFLVDIDGVLTCGSSALPGAVDALRVIQTQGRVVLLTNNSTRSQREVAQYLSLLTLEVAAEDVLPTSTLAARYLRERAGATTVWVVGEAGLRDELIIAGHELADRPDRAEWLVVGMDRRLDYEKLRLALQALLGGARLLATNEDATYPTGGGLVPGAGAVVGALRGMGYAPEAVVGKPSRLAFEVALAQLALPAERVLMIGDRLDTDIVGARAAGLDSALVLSGVSAAGDLARTHVRPTWVAASLADLCAGRAQRCAGDDDRLSG
ncbi:MAG: HAD-IIA family hydrolase [Candidatus Bipolaricaulis sp.]|nr:HAD-IIA family hydrolase [Candidatus Bipolaricaulis sp.]